MAANGQKLRVAVTKTSAQGKAAQSATPNLMSFSTDENSVWFNGKKYGVHKFNNVSSLNTNSTAEQVLSALNVSKSSELYDLAHKGVLFIDTISGNTIVKYEDEDDTFQLYVPSSDSRSIKKLTITVSSNKVTGLTTISHLIVDDIRNTLTSTETNKALSAAMGKKLQDEKLSKTDASNTYAKKADGISHYSIGELTALSSNPTQEQLKTALGTPTAFRNAIDAGKLILVTGNANVQSQKSATCIIDSGNVIVKYLHFGNNDWTIIAQCVPASSGDNWDNAQFSVRIVKPSDSTGITIE